MCIKPISVISHAEYYIHRTADFNISTKTQSMFSITPGCITWRLNKVITDFVMVDLFWEDV